MSVERQGTETTNLTRPEPWTPASLPWLRLPQYKSELAEREGFEPSVRFWRTHTFQACSFDRSDTSPALADRLTDLPDTRNLGPDLPIHVPSPTRYTSEMDSSPLAIQLSKTSALYQDPVHRIDWPGLALPGFWMPPEALSLAGLPQFEAQDTARQQLLSKLEFLNFLEGGVWLEALFMERMAQVLRHQRLDLAHLKYRAHEIREEAGHTLMFLEVMERSGHQPSGRRRMTRWLELFARHVPAESLEFWLAVILGEDVPDQMNRYVRRHPAGINPVILQVCSLHVIDEARHIAYGRALVRHRSMEASRIRLRFTSALTSRLLQQFLGVFYYPPASLYEAAGLRPGAAWRRAAMHNPNRTRFLRQLLEPSLRLLQPLSLSLRLP